MTKPTRMTMSRHSMTWPDAVESLADLFHLTSDNAEGLLHLLIGLGTIKADLSNVPEYINTTHKVCFSNGE